MAASASCSVFVPEEVCNEASQAIGKLIPTKSKAVYEREYTLFCQWRDKKKAKGVDEKIILAYISERSKNTKSSSLWAYYSQIKKMISVKENVDISSYHQVRAFMKQHAVGHKPKKSNVFTKGDLENFLDRASDKEYLLIKVVFIMGIAGGCRVGELVSMSVDDVDDRGSVLIVKIPDTKTYKERVFTVVNGSNSVHAIEVFRKYRLLRPKNVQHKRLFLAYRNEKCIAQPVGLNTFSKMPLKIAQFLGLPDAAQYTGHSFRRSSATLLANAGADLTVLKRHGGWRSNTVAEGYIEDSLENKMNIAKKILGEEKQQEDCGVSVNLPTVTPHSSCSFPSSRILDVESSIAEQTTMTISSTESNTTLLSSALCNQVLPSFNNLNNCNFYFNFK